jgi:molybdenum cofactor biosynthesis enzyme MoaA
MKGLQCVHAENGLRVSNDGFVTPCCFYDDEYKFKDKNGDFLHTSKNTVDEIMNSPDAVKLREDLRNGIKHPGCKRCWDEEEYINSSKRARDTGYLYFQEDAKVRYVELNLGNTCNLACRTCNVGASIKWAEENKMIYHKEMPDNEYKEHVRQFYKSYENDSIFWLEMDKSIEDIIQIDMYGGEPFLMKKQWELLQKSIDEGHSKNQILHFNTNGTIFNEKYLNILKQFKRVNIGFSIDGVGERFEYIRHHGIWSDVHENIKKWLNFAKDNDNMEIMLCYTLSILNVYYTDEIIRYSIDNNITMYFNLLVLPDYYSIKNIPEPIKIKITNKLNSFMDEVSECDNNMVRELTNILHFMNSNTSEPKKWDEFIKFTDFLDKSRKQSFKTVFSEFYNTFNKLY